VFHKLVAIRGKVRTAAADCVTAIYHESGTMGRATVWIAAKTAAGCIDIRKRKDEIGFLIRK
jgi:hypothetical protein